MSILRKTCFLLRLWLTQTTQEQRQTTLLLVIWLLATTVTIVLPIILLKTYLPALLIGVANSVMLVAMVAIWRPKREQEEAK